MARMKWMGRGMLAVALAAAVAPALACTRAVYLGDNGDVITARSMDWKVDVATNLYITYCRAALRAPARPARSRWRGPRATARWWPPATTCRPPMA